jgi:hypothetical protein
VSVEVVFETHATSEDNETGRAVETAEIARR